MEGSACFGGCFVCTFPLLARDFAMGSLSVFLFARMRFKEEVSQFRPLGPPFSVPRWTRERFANWTSGQVIVRKHALETRLSRREGH